jgi:hypothetical protein
MSVIGIHECELKQQCVCITLCQGWYVPLVNVWLGVCVVIEKCQNSVDACHKFLFFACIRTAFLSSPLVCNIPLSSIDHQSLGNSLCCQVFELSDMLTIYASEIYSLDCATRLSIRVVVLEIHYWIMFLREWMESSSMEWSHSFNLQLHN